MSIDKRLKKLFEDSLLQDIEKEDLTLFDVPENLKSSTKDKPDYVAQRIHCANFSDYELGFKQVHQELRLGKRSLKRLSTSQSLQSGSYYITSGVMIFLENIEELVAKKKRKKSDARTRCIYENGTESDIYLDTLRKSITTDGYVVTESADTINDFFESKFDITPDDVQDGWIYILSSLSQNTQIKEQKNLYKIGFSTKAVKDRIANAQNEPTYLMDKVKIEKSWRTYNMNTQRFENLIHHFFSEVQFNFIIKDKDGSKFKAREWYTAPLNIIEAVINRIIDKSIVNYRYNASLESLELVENRKEDKHHISGMEVIKLNIKKTVFDEITTGTKKNECIELRQSTLNKYTWVSNEDGKRYIKKTDALKISARKNSILYSALIEVVDITYDANKKTVKYHLGRVLYVSN